MKLPFLPAVLREPLERRPWLAGLILVVLAIGVLWLLRTTRHDLSATSYFEVRRGDFMVSVVEGGALQAVSEVSIRNEVEGTSRIIYLVPEGTYVRQGDLLVELDSMQAQDQFNQQQINFEKAQFALLQAEKQLDIQRSVVESEVSAAELKYLLAKMDLDKYLEGESKVNLLTASNNITKIEEQLTIDRETLRWSEQLTEKGYETRNVLDRDRLTVTNGILNLQIQRMQLDMIQNYDFPKRKAEYESAFVETGKNLERVKQQGSNRIAQYVADMLTQSNTLVLNANKLQRDRNNLEKTKLRAPQDGLVVYPVMEGRFSQESMIEEGATVRNRQELIKLPDTARMKVTVKVHESSVNMVQAGQPAFVVLDSQPDQRYRAYVDRVALLPDTQARFGNPNLKVYNTDVVITDPLPDVKPGVSARAEIIITNVANTLSVPVQAVTTLRGQQVVYLAAKTPKPVPVEIGLFNTRFIQLLSGVNENDRVLLAPPFDSQEKDLEGALLAKGEQVDFTNNIPRPITPRPGANDRPREGATAPTPGAMGTPESAGPVSQGATIAEPGSPPGGGIAGAPGAGMPGGVPVDREQMRQQMEALRKEFDTDGDGQLDESERQAMREEMQRRFPGMGTGTGGGRAGGGARGEGGGGQGGSRGGGGEGGTRTGGGQNPRPSE
jgi:HlyD family secretion protein